MPQIKDLAAFIAIHREQEARLLRYLDMARSNYQQLDRETQLQLKPSQARYLHANNTTARIRFVQIVNRHVVAEIDGASGDVDLHFVTFIPDVYAAPLFDSQDYDIAPLQEWVRGVLDGHDFVGIVEAALFPSWLRGKPIISWHVHAVVFGAKRYRVDHSVAPVRANFRSLVPGIDAVRVEAMTPTELEEKLLYLQKFPLTAYRPNPETAVGPDVAAGKPVRYRTGRWRISKPDLRTGELVKMCRVLAPHYLDQMLFGGGRGAAIVDAIRAEALPGGEPTVGTSSLSLRMSQRARR